VQCTPDLAPAQCWHCFQGVRELNRRWYDGREGGRVLGVRCRFRYEGYQFYARTPHVRIGLQEQGGSSSAAAGNGGNRQTTASSTNFFILIIILILEPTKSIISSQALTFVETQITTNLLARQPQLPLSFN
jgi:hypothetical protein